MDVSEAKMLPKFADLVSGFCEEIPSQESTTVQVFLSSTFTDMIHERNKLLREVYPKLQRYCQERGLDFEVVDMRWGVHDNVTTDHKTTELCMMEIDNCKKLSQGPCFVAFLGNKYGYRPLRAVVSAGMFEKFLELIKDDVDPSDADLLRDWYQKDENALPPVYLLQSINSKLRHYDDEEREDLQREARNRWWNISNVMRSTLQKAAQKAVTMEIYSQEEVQMFFSSVTEQEVQQVFKDNNNPEANVLVFLRHLDGVAAAEQPIRKKFIDCVDDGSVNEEAQELLRRLKEDVIPTKLPASSIYHYNIPWREGGLDPADEEHKRYLTDITNQFYLSIVEMINNKLSGKPKIASADLNSFYEELIHHHTFQEAKCKSFKGREDVFTAVRHVLEDKAHKPCVLHGISGSGKTSVMAMLARTAKSIIPGDIVCILRFLGTSSLSSSIRDTLLSVCQQICFAYGLEQPRDDEVEDFHKLDMFFKSLLTKAPTKEKPLIILLDSIDQLSSTNNAYSMNWLPLNVPKFTHIVVSMLPVVHNCLQNMQKLLDDRGCYVEMTPVKQNLGLEIVDGWLENHKRQITEEQRTLISSAISNCPQPLYLKILFEEFSKWPSYYLVRYVSLPATVRAAITFLFEELERKYGELLVSHALGYLTAGRQGLTDSELRDVLSCDDEVLDVVYQYWDPPEETVIRIPSSVLKRIRYDIKEFLTQRQAGGKTVHGWYHRQFIEAAFDRYLREPSTFSARHKLLSDMYLDVYCEGKINPVELSLRGKVFPNADRQVAPQPLEFDEDLFNLRKLQELPYHLYCCKDSERLCANVIYDYEWLFAKLRSCSFIELIGDLELTDVDCSVLKDSLLMSRSSIQSNPNSLAGQLVARIGDRRDHSHFLDLLLGECEQWMATSSQPLFVPRSSFLKPPGGPLVTTFAGHPSRVLKVVASHVHRVMISACEDADGHPLAYLWDTETYELIQDVHVPNHSDGGFGSIILEVDEKGDHFAFGSEELRLFKMSNGDEIFPLNCNCGGDGSAFKDMKFLSSSLAAGFKQNGTELLVWSMEDGALVDRLENASTVTHLDVINNSTMVSGSVDGKLRWWSTQTMSIKNTAQVLEDGKFTALIASNDYVFCSGDDGSLQLWTSCGTSPQPVHVFPAHHRPVSRMFLFNQATLVCGYFDGTLKFWDVSSKECLRSTKVHRKELTCFAAVGDLLIAGSLDDTLSVWSSNRDDLVNTLEGHSSWIADVAAVTAKDDQVMIFSSSNDKSVTLWDPEDHLVNDRERHTQQPHCLAATRDGESLFTGSSDGTIKHWDFTSGKCVHTWEISKSTSLVLIDEDRWLVGGFGDGSVKMWNVNTLEESDLSQSHTDSVNFLTNASSPTSFISGSKDKLVKIWDRSCCVMTLEGHTDAVVNGKCSQDGRDVYVTVTKNGEVKFWDKVGHCLETKMHCKGTELVVVSHNDQYVVTGSKGKTMIVWSLAEGNIGSKLRELSVSDDSVKGLAFTHDDSFIVCGMHTGKKQLYKWNFMDDDSSLSMYFEGHTHAVMWLYITSNDKYLFTGSRDCTLKAWDLTSGKILDSFNCACQIKFFEVAEMTESHYRVMAANKTGEMGLFDFYLDSACRVPNYCLKRPAEQKINENGLSSPDQFTDQPSRLRTKMSKRSKLCHLV